MNELRQSKAFRAWVSGLRDQNAKAYIAARLLRLKNGLKGDAKPVGKGISELRIHYGPGYRIYFQQRERTIILLLCGGVKNTQSQDIFLAQMFAKTWIEEDEYEE